MDINIYYDSLVQNKWFEISNFHNKLKITDTQPYNVYLIRTKFRAY